MTTSLFLVIISKSEEDIKGIIVNVQEKQCDKMVSTPDSPCIHTILDKDGNISMCALPDQFRCTEAIKANAIWLSHSAVQDYLRCKRLYWYKNIRGVELLPQYLSDPVKMGKLWDKLQSLRYGVDDVTETTVADYIDELQIPDVCRAKVSAVYRAYCDLIEPDKKDLVGLQQHFIWHYWDKPVGDIIVHGYYDRLYKDRFVECKFTSDQRYYNNVWALNSQIGTYFLANENLRSVTMEIIQVPRQKLYKAGKQRAEDETIEDYEERVYSEIMANPYNVFIGYNHEDKSYGLQFYRDEFNLKELEYRYKWITIEIQDRAKRNSFYIEDNKCFMYNTMCDYYDVCTAGGNVNFERYRIREKNQDEGN